MKHISKLLSAFSFLLFAANGYAQTEKDTVYVFLENMPDAGIYLPPPPDMLSTQYADDFAQWQ